ncbi:acetyltransferase [Nonlabens sp.]|uniref:acetyltransferase n=1 Tax=Nonlabens sp. TaxID=1888209 RepID=UPI003F6A30E8
MYIFGASGHGKVVFDVLTSKGTSVTGFIDDNPNITEFCGKSVASNHIPQELIIAIGDNKIRKKISNLFPDAHFCIAIDANAIVAEKVTIGKGTVIMPAAVANRDVVIGNHVIINTNCTVEHDGTIGDYAHISPGSTLCGNVTIGEGTHIGANATVLPGVVIGKWCNIGAGTVVLKDIPDFSTVVGNPGRIIKTHNET